MRELPIIQNRKIYFAVSAAFVLVSIAGMLVFGFRLGLDFVGGSSWQIQFSDENMNQDTLRKFFSKSGFENTVITRELSTNSFIVRLESIGENRHQELAGALSEQFGEILELRFDSIGPVIGRELRDKAVWAAILVLLGISLFVSYSFRKVSYPIRSWQYGIVTLLTLFHDVAITIGLLVFLGEFLNVEMDSNSVVAILVVMGFSVHDTIVVFDRIRENLRLQTSKIDFEAVVNKSVNDTIARSINTSLTLIVVLLALLFFGPASLKFFLITLTVGVVAGTYSSVFVASPILAQWYVMKK